jgi:hypothetical protein
MEKTHWKRLINPDYLGAYSLPEGQDMTVVIQSVSKEMVTGTGGKKDECTVAKLQGNKPMILNNTNCKTIAKLYGAYIEDWAGKPITLFASTTKLAGDTVECLRIRPVVSAPPRPPIPQDRFEKALEQVKLGKFDAQKLSSDFALTSAQRAQLNSVVDSNA